MTATVPELASARLRMFSPLAEGFDPVAAYLDPQGARFIDAADDPDALWWSVAMISGHWHLRGYGHFAVAEKDTGLDVGLVGPWFPSGWPEPELSWHLLDSATGQGFATEAAERVLDWIFDDLGWSTVISLIADSNDASRELAERLGARPEGMFRHRLSGELRIWRHMPAARRRLQ